MVFSVKVSVPTDHYIKSYNNVYYVSLRHLHTMHVKTLMIGEIRRFPFYKTEVHVF